MGIAIRGHIILFEHANFRGHHRHIFNEEPDLNHNDDPSLNDKVSSFVVLRGTWRLFRHANYRRAYSQDFPPGVYSYVINFDVENDDISSLKCI